MLALAGAAPRPIAPVLDRLAATNDVGTLTGPDYDALTACIERGDATCIAAVGPLGPTGNAERGEGLVAALSHALRTNPTAVLRLARIRTAELGRLCADPDIEPSAREVAAHRRAAARALDKVRDPALRERRDACLAAVTRRP